MPFDYLLSMVKGGGGGEGGGGGGEGGGAQVQSQLGRAERGGGKAILIDFTIPSSDPLVPLAVGRAETQGGNAISIDFTIPSSDPPCPIGRISSHDDKPVTMTSQPFSQQLNTHS